MTGEPLNWRVMTVADLPAVKALADVVHPHFPEDEAVFANRLALHPYGCGVLQGERAIAGYVVSHPWHFKQPPQLNELLAAPTAPPSTFYIHDLALLPETRRTGAGAIVVAMLAARARLMQLPNMTLVAVNNSVHFWRRQGFDIVVDPTLDRQLRSYDEHASYMRRELT
jgi:ribosomal protein S18 acetylase RimI-like enzyme